MPLKIQKNIPLAKYTTFKIGGPAEYFCSVNNLEELEEATRYATGRNMNIFILAGGSNLVISDQGIKGLVIKINSFIDSEDDDRVSKEKIYCQKDKYFIVCQAGETLASIVSLAAKNGLSGMEWAAGIPGTIGGAIRGNAGAFGQSIADNVFKVKAFDLKKMKLRCFTKSESKFSYRQSLYKKSHHLIITSAILKLAKGDRGEINAKISEIFTKRAEKQPKGFASPGSYFKNPVVKDLDLIEKFEKDTGLACRDNKLPAGWLVADAGLLGKKIGGAMVSKEHGNFIVNTGKAKADDVIMLVSLIKQKIRNQYDIQLKEEVQYAGFD